MLGNPADNNAEKKIWCAQHHNFFLSILFLLLHLKHFTNYMLYKQKHGTLILHSQKIDFSNKKRLHHSQKKIKNKLQYIFSKFFSSSGPKLKKKM